MEASTQTPSSTNELHSAERLLNDLKELIQRAEQKAVEQAKAADRVVRTHPYPTIGAALGLGLLVGFLVGRK